MIGHSCTLNISAKQMTRDNNDHIIETWYSEAYLQSFQEKTEHFALLKIISLKQQIIHKIRA